MGDLKKKADDLMKNATENAISSIIDNGSSLKSKSILAIKETTDSKGKEQSERTVEIE